MNLKSIVLKPIVTVINSTTGNNYSVEDFSIVKVNDPLGGELRGNGEYAGEHRCMYDMLTADVNGIRLRLTIKPDNFTSMEALVFDTYSGEEFNDNRSTYSATYRLNAVEVGLTAGTRRCPDLSALYLQGCSVIATEDGKLIMTEQGRYLLQEGSECDDGDI